MISIISSWVFGKQAKIFCENLRSRSSSLNSEMRFMLLKRLSNEKIEHSLYEEDLDKSI